MDFIIWNTQVTLEEQEEAQMTPRKTFKKSNTLVHSFYYFCSVYHSIVSNDITRDVSTIYSNTTLPFIFSNHLPLTPSLPRSFGLSSNTRWFEPSADITTKKWLPGELPQGLLTPSGMNNGTWWVKLETGSNNHDEYDHNCDCCCDWSWFDVVFHFKDDKRKALDLDINVIPIWNQGITGKGVVVTILDDGKEFYPNTCLQASTIEWCMQLVIASM